METYSPLGVGKLLSNEKINAVAKKNNVSPARVCIKYTALLDTIPLPRSRSFDHMKDIFFYDFELSQEDKEELDKISTL